MEATQTNNPSFTSINKDLEIPKSPAAGSQEVWQKAAKLTEAGFYAAIWYMGVPSPLIPVIKCSADLAISIVTDPQVQQTASQIGSQIGSTTKGAYFWTARTASSAKDKTTQAVSYTYNYTIEKTSQGINYSRDLMPSLWWKYNSNMTNQKIPGLSYGIAYFGNQYKRQSISQDDNGVKV